MIMTCQRSFIDCNQRPPLLEDVDRWRRPCVCMAGRERMGNLYFLLSFAVNLKLV